MNKLNQIINNSAVSVLQTVVSAAVLFILYRYMLVTLGAAQLGLWSVILASTSAARLSDMGFIGSVVKFVAKYRAANDESGAAAVVETAAISIAVVMAGICFALYPYFDEILAISVPKSSMREALEILPWALTSLWVGCIGGVFQSALDGCQRMDTRNFIMIFSNVTFLCAAFWLIPVHGIIGLAFGQVAQSAVTVVVSWVFLRNYQANLNLVPLNFSKTKFKEMFGYAFNFQINSVAIMLFDPVVKLFMSRYGGLSGAGYYELASQVVIKSRALLVAAIQSISPAVAEMQEREPHKIPIMYLASYELMFFVALSCFSLLYVAVPIFSVMWIGVVQPEFLVFSQVLIIGWALNTMNTPSYFVNLGTGDLKWNSISHVIMAIANLLIGSYLGRKFGSIGVVVAAMVALVGSSSLVIGSFHKKYEINIKKLIPRNGGVLLLVSSIVVISSTLINSCIKLDVKPGLITNGTLLGGYILSVSLLFIVGTPSNYFVNALKAVKYR